MRKQLYGRNTDHQVFFSSEAAKPIPKDDEALMKVHATSLNAADLEFLRGMFSARLLYQGLLKPKSKISGTDIAGRIEAVGRNVARFRPGDAREDVEWRLNEVLVASSAGTGIRAMPGSALRGVLAKIRDMNLPLMSVTQVVPHSEDKSRARSEGDARAD